jgi:hypothetical protein
LNALQTDLEMQQAQNQALLNKINVNEKIKKFYEASKYP